MSGVITNVVKGKMLGYVDARLSRREGELAKDYRDRLQELLDRFKTGTSHVDHAKTATVAGIDQKVATTPAEEAHAKDEFFGDTPGLAYFPGMPGDSEDEIVRGGYIRAIELALGPNPLSPPKPIVSYWIINGRQDTDPDAFEVFVSESDREVHVLMLTPRPARHQPAPNDPNRAIVERMYVVSTTSRVDAIGAAWPNSYPKNEVPMAGTNGVKCLQVVGY